ncbi:hypothetical protein L8P27_05175 [Enterobacter asburiae]|uniref:hypothetical protein n=1 Tax=Enterobacter asburiae TaxID=61645 RepID=UPI002004C871|nr:hypothetical protein [Enterobacter asburiae]MCK7227244.1 hypothetical protein [Enterobacter asburiae]
MSIQIGRTQYFTPQSDNKKIETKPRVDFYNVKYLVRDYEARGRNHVDSGSGEFFKKNVRNEDLLVCCGNKETLINFNKVLKDTQEIINKCGGDDAVWRTQELTTYISAEINRAIDVVCSKFQRSLNNQQKNDIFSKVNERCGISNKYCVSIDTACAQSTIKQMLNTESYVKAKVQDVTLSPSKKDFTINSEDNVKNNKIKNDVIDKLAAKTFEHYFSIPESTVNRIKFEAARLSADLLAADGMESEA